MKKQKSFTLIELLVVIAIIGLLTAIGLLSIREAKEKAGMAKILQFSAQIYHALGAYASGIWDFDERTFPVKDRSGDGNDGSCTNCPDWSDEGDTPSGNGYALEFNGNDDCIEIPDSDSLDDMDAITIEFWIKPHEKNKYYFISKKDCYEYQYKNYRLEFKVYNKDIGHFKVEAKADVSIEFGEWHHLAASYNGSSEIKLFLDGKNLSLSEHKVKEGGPVGDEDNILYLGCKDGNKEHYDGFMDEVKIYRETLSVAKIQKLYAKGAIKRELLTKE